MKKNTLISAALSMVSSLTFAGGLLTNTNQNVAFLRNPARDGAIGIDGVYSNPAGVVWLTPGFHLSLNIQSAYQTRIVKSTFAPFAYGVKNNGQETKRFEGEASAPIVPSFQAAYNTERWSFSASFAVTGGGGKCTFDNGLGSFESQAALLPLVGKEMGINKYSMDSYMRGRQYYYGFQIGAGYKINENLSAFVGGRVLYANCNYFGHVRNIEINNPGTSTMVRASDAFGGLRDQMIAAAALAISQGDMAAAAGYSEKAKEYGTLSVATKDVELNCDQTGWGFTPIIGLDYKIGKWNFGAKYEFRTRMRLRNESANSESANNLAALDTYKNGRKVDADVPGYLTLGAQFEILPSLRVMAGYHHFFDKQTKQEGNAQDLLDKNTNEYLFGVEYDITKRIQASIGMQSTNYGLTDAYMKDMSFTTSSTSLGLGLGIQLSKKAKLNLAYFHTFYQTYEKESQDYNNVSAVVGAAKGQPMADALVESGAVKGRDSFTRKNKVFGIGLDISF